uniref:4Fe-4S ferredoxin n=1 Tax=Macrostomum lignano TaxID=282301 RepID=A0A1I8H4B1_9PLAT
MAVARRRGFEFLGEHKALVLCGLNNYQNCILCSSACQSYVRDNVT